MARSATARLVIDGREYTCLKRNPADQTGRESVTIIDDSVPTVVFDEVDPLHRFGDIRSDGAECYFRHTGGFRGAEVPGAGPPGDRPERPRSKLPAINSDATTYFRFAFKKTNANRQGRGPGDVR